MHTVNLGVDLWTVGSVMRKLFEYDIFGGLRMGEEDRYLIAYDLFKTWSRENKVWHLSSDLIPSWFCFILLSPSYVSRHVLFLILVCSEFFFESGSEEPLITDHC